MEKNLGPLNIYQCGSSELWKTELDEFIADQMLATPLHPHAHNFTTRDQWRTSVSLTSLSRPAGEHSRQGAQSPTDRCKEGLYSQTSSACTGSSFHSPRSSMPSCGCCCCCCSPSRRAATLISAQLSQNYYSCVSPSSASPQQQHTRNIRTNPRAT